MADMLTVQPFQILRGDTWRSPKFSFFNEDLTQVLPPNFTQDDIDEAIADGRLTFRNWNDYVISADVKRGGASGVLWFILSDYKKIDATGRFLWFEMTPDETKALEHAGFEDLPITGTYDIEFCKEGDVVTVWRGDVTLTADITEREVCE